MQKQLTITLNMASTLKPLVSYFLTRFSILGFSGYQPLMRAYIGQSLRKDLERLDAQPDLSELFESLRKHGVTDDILASAMADMSTVV